MLCLDLNSLKSIGRLVLWVDEVVNSDTLLRRADTMRWAKLLRSGFVGLVPRHNSTVS